MTLHLLFSLLVTDSSKRHLKALYSLIPILQRLFSSKIKFTKNRTQKHINMIEA